ncbi:MAG TPA: hypothetical protein VKA84_14445, partial [Gemmatimonadaceae bacterium]|nr:hypothetical protein [Gemmatimonadaceae bacterium]
MDDGAGAVTTGAGSGADTTGVAAGALSEARVAAAGESDACCRRSAVASLSGGAAGGVAPATVRGAGCCERKMAGLDGAGAATLWRAGAAAADGWALGGTLWDALCAAPAVGSCWGAPGGAAP